MHGARFSRRITAFSNKSCVEDMSNLSVPCELLAIASELAYWPRYSGPHRFHVSASHRLVKRTAHSFHRRDWRLLGAHKCKKRASVRSRGPLRKATRQNGVGSDASSASLRAAEPEATVSGSGSPRTNGTNHGSRQITPLLLKKSDERMKRFSLKHSTDFSPISKSRGQLSLNSTLASGEGRGFRSVRVGGMVYR